VKWTVLLVALFLTTEPMWPQPSAGGQKVEAKPAHDRDFWRAIPKSRYAVPPGQPIFLLLRELSGYLGSNDPELRDDLAYTITAVWIKHQSEISADDLNTLLDEWRANLRLGIGETGTDSVLKRSFSALCLASLAERDLKAPFLTEERYRDLLSAALVYLKDERDLRGFDPTLGWIHATAHTADLLSALAGNRFFRSDDQARLLDAIAARLSSAHEIFAYGEQDRLALAAATIARRNDFYSAAFDRWLAALDAADQRVWKDSPPKIDLLQTFENDTYMLRGLAVYLSASPPSSAVAGTRDAVMKILQGR
jgi:Protein of unknown function (DUF2785)